ncbi:hypothetical protein DFQ05_0155 [Winogradskyella wandonensis]|uniref:Uncharacterized protein n=1 Tax=Winogradskyella wandonensis TaxID=1442586 RepID=A0A4R1KV98_9FLAO|nr:hypothetical protein [Winogradskyella wandonensis]TCK68647.1 hypothetical protein DFQ05_0155 [Winogradskyella wandonensis]
MGIVQQYQNPVANQEIVLRFNEQLSETEAQLSLEEVSNSLEKIGVNTISITSEKGIYRISYYSDSATKNIKKLLSEITEITFDSTSDKDQKKRYDFDVLNIKKGSTSAWDFEAQQVSVLHLKSDRSFQPDAFKFPVLVEAGKLQIDIKVTYNACEHSVFVADNTSYNIPEVRAGPLA